MYHISLIYHEENTLNGKVIEKIAVFVGIRYDLTHLKTKCLLYYRLHHSMCPVLWRKLSVLMQSALLQPDM